MRAYDFITGERYKRVWLILMFAIVSFIFCSALIIVFLFTDDPKKLINSLGLTLEIFGVILASYLIIFPRKSNSTPKAICTSDLYPSDKDKEYEEKHSFKLSFGVILIVYGFVIQLFSNWV